MATISESFNLTDGLGLLELRETNEFDTMLVCAGQPVAMNWCDCSGSVGQYLWRANIGSNVERELWALRHVLSIGLSPAAKIADQCQLLLKLFVNGPYTLIHAQAEDFDVVEYTFRDREVDAFYPYPELDWIVTQAQSSLNPDTVTTHRNAICEGKRPVVVVASTKEALASYVIDGHHKLRAYIDAQVKPWYLNIVTMNPKPIEPSEGEAVLADSRLLQHYRTWKRKSATWK